MRISLFRAKEELSNSAPADQLERRISRVCEKAITSGKWNGSLHTIDISVRYGELALPRQYRAIEGVRVDGIVRDIVNAWYVYLPGKSDTYGYSMENVENLGDGFATMYRLPLGGRGYGSAPTATVVGDGTGGTLRVQMKDGSVSSIDIEEPGQGYTTATVVFSGDSGIGAEAVLAISSDGTLSRATMVVRGTLALSGNVPEDLVMTVYGTDENYMPLELMISDSTPVSNPFTHIDRIHRDYGTSTIALTHIATDGSETTLARMAPREEEMYLRKYFIGTLVSKPESTVRALAKMRFIPFTSDQDILPFSNISALESFMRGEQFLAENDVSLSDQYYADGYKILNNELKDGRAVDELPVIRMLYPGGTTPNFTSRY